MKSPDELPDTSCACEACVRCCEWNPGWFRPHELAPAAALLGITVEELKAQYLIRDWWAGDGDNPRVEVWAPFKQLTPRGDFREALAGFGDLLESLIHPSTRGEADQPGGVASYSYGLTAGRCTFLTPEGRCRIYAARPWECRVTRACGSEDEKENLRPLIVEEWRQAGVTA